MTPKYTVCPRCEGEGTVANPVFDGMGTSEIYDDMGFEEGHEFLTEYTKRGGMYDISCPCCNGARVATAEQVAKWEDDLAFQAEMAAEMRYGGMY